MSRISVTVKVFSYFRKYLTEDKDSYEVELAEGSTVMELARDLGIPDSELDFTTILVNGKYVSKHFQLVDGNMVNILPILAGG